MDTIVSQAHGAKNYRIIGIAFQNSLVVVTLFSIPIALLWWFTEPILVLFAQDPIIAKGAGLYNKLSIPGLIPCMYYRAIGQYLQNQRILYPAVIAGIIGIIVSVGLNWFLIFGLKMGFVGAPIAGSITFAFMAATVWIYVLIRGINKKTCESCDWKRYVLLLFYYIFIYILFSALNPTLLLEYLKLGIPASLMLVFEILGFEIVTLLVGSFKNTVAIASHAICFNILIFAYILPLGYSAGCGTRVGNLLGQGDSKRSQICTLIGLISIGSILTFLSLIFISLSKVIPRAYTDNEEVIKFASKLIYLTAFVFIFDGLQTIEGSILRSIGKPFQGSIVNFVGYYLLSVPIGAGLAFGAKLGALGLWIGLLSGVMGSTTGYAIILSRIDWYKEVENAKKRVGVRSVNELELEKLNGFPPDSKEDLSEDELVELNDHDIFEE